MAVDKGARSMGRARRMFQRTAVGDDQGLGNGLVFDPAEGAMSIDLRNSPAPGLELAASGLGILLDPSSSALQLTTGLKVDLDSSGGLEVASGLAIKLDGDSLEVGSSGLKVGGGVPVWSKFTLGFADFSAAATTNDAQVFELPARGVILATKIKHSASFTGGSISAYTISVGIAGQLDKYLGAFDVFQAAGDTVLDVSGTAGGENEASATSIRAEATSTGDNLDQASAGSVDIWVLSTVPPA